MTDVTTALIRSLYSSPKDSGNVSYDSVEVSNTTLPPECLGAPDKNYNDTYMSTGYSYQAVIVFSVLVGLFCLYVLLGNVAVIVVILRDRVISSQPQNQYLISLAVADALLAVLVVPFTLVNELSGKWPFGAVYCQVYLATDVLLCTASIWGICAIGLDRYWSVKRPVNNRRKRTKKVIRLIILAVWALSFAISVLPFIFGFQTIPTSAEESCFINDASWYILLSCTLSFFLPAIIIAPVYTKIYLIGRKHSRPMASWRKRSKASSRKVASKASSANNNHEDNEFVEDHGKSLQNGGNKVQSNRESSSSADHHAEDNDSQENSDPGPLSCVYTARNGRHSLPSGVQDNGVAAKAENGRRDGASAPLREIPQESSRRESRERRRMFSALSTHKALSMSSVIVFCKRKNRRESDTKTKKEAYYHKRERRFTIIICIVTGGFLFCWYPFFQTYVVYAICGEKCCINKNFFKAIFWLGYMNSAFNPAIYTIFNKEFRKAFRRLLF